VFLKEPLEDAKTVNPSFGRVPKYLHGIKKDIAETKAAEAAAAERAKLPPGMRLLTEDERLETLQQLLDEKEATFLEYNRLPIAANTMAIRNRRNELENKLTELETAVKVFTRPKVYVADN
jgi:hypothetical protein